MKLNKIFFEDVAVFIRDRIASVLYVSDGKTSTAELRSVEITDNGNILIEVAIEKTNIRITELHLLGLNGHLWAKQETNITLDQRENDAGVVFRFEINLKEAMTNV